MRSASADDLAEAGRRLGRNDVALKIEDLVGAFRAGLGEYIEEVAHDSARLQNIERQATPWFTHMDKEIIKKFLRVSE